VLKDIRDNPCNFLRKHTLVNLRHFLLGFELCASFFNFETIPHAPSSLHKFVKNKYLTHPTENHFLRIMDDFYKDEHSAFSEFFKTLDEYIEKEIHKKDELELFNTESRSITNLNDEYYIILSLLRVRPNVYLDFPCIYNLEAFIAGFHFCAKMNKFIFEPHLDFSSFVIEKYEGGKFRSEFDAISYNYENIEAFHAFFVNLDEFLADKNMIKYRKLLRNSSLR